MHTKYELIDSDIPGLKRIRALKDFGNGVTYITKNSVGGYVRGEHNLSQEGDCWIFHAAKVYDNACIQGDARIFDNVEIYSTAQISGNARISGNAEIQGNVRVFDNARIYGKTRISGNAKIYGNAEIFDEAIIVGNVKIYGNARIFNNAEIFGNAQILDNAKISGNARIHGNARVFGNVWVSNNSQIFENAETTKCLYIQQVKHSITATDTHVFIGCEGHTWEHWMENIDQIGTKHEYTEEQIKDIKTLLEVVQRQIQHMLKTIL